LGSSARGTGTIPLEKCDDTSLEGAAGAPIPAALQPLEALLRTGQVLVLADQTKTTQRHRQAERDTATTARRLSAGRVKPIPEAMVPPRP
jgi:hypothetical protein